MESVRERCRSDMFSTTTVIFDNNQPFVKVGNDLRTKPGAECHPVGIPYSAGGKGLINPATCVDTKRESFCRHRRNWDIFPSFCLDDDLTH